MFGISYFDAMIGVRNGSDDVRIRPVNGRPMLWSAEKSAERRSHVKSVDDAVVDRKAGGHEDQPRYLKELIAI